MEENYVANTIRRSEVEHGEKWSEINKSIPSFNFDKEWDIKIIPPFGGAVARFLVFKGDNRICSVYLDWFGRLGAVYEPYYELYPYENDVKRYLLDDTDELISDIRDLYNEGQ
jgi:hypothetical protein